MNLPYYNFFLFQVAYNALKALYHHKSPIGLVGNHIDVMTGRWTAQDAGIGGGVDSYFEYLVKGLLLICNLLNDFLITQMFDTTLK